MKQYHVWCRVSPPRFCSLMLKPCTMNIFYINSKSNKCTLWKLLLNLRKKTFDSCHLWDCTDLTNPRLRIRLKKKVSTLNAFQTMKQNFSRSLTHEYPCKDAPVVLYVWGKSSLPSLPHTNFFLASSPTRAAVQCGLSELSFTFDIHTSAPLEPQAWIRQAYNRPAHCPACFPLYNSWSG